MNFKEKVVVIVGGTSGLGLCMVNQLLAKDIKVIIVFELETTSSTKVFNELQKEHGERIDFYPCEITNASQLERNFNKVSEKYNTIDILINTTFILNENDPERMIDINYKSVVMASLMMVERVGKHKGGKGGIIINIASILGLRNFILPIYSSTKHAVVSFTRTMMQHFDVTGVRLIAICPGVTNIPIINDHSKGLDFINGDGKINLLPPMQSPESVASALVKIVGEGKSGDVWVAEEDQPPYQVRAVEDYTNLRINE